MQKLLLFMAFIYSCNIIMQFGLTGIIFNEDFKCRSSFSNMTECFDSVIIPCHCRAAFGQVIFISVFDELSVAMASILFISMAILEIRKIVFCGNSLILNQHHNHLSLLELLCPIGFFTILLTPALKPHIKHIKILCRQYSIFTILYDLLAIGLVVRYYSQTNSKNPILIITIGLSSVHILFQMIELYIANRRDFEKSFFKSQSEVLVKGPPPYLNV